MMTLLEKINSHQTKGSIKDLVFPVSTTYNLSKKETVVFINTGDIHEGKFLHSNQSDAKKLPGQAKKVIEHGDILFSEIRPKNRHYALVDFDAQDYVVSTKLIVLKVREGINPTFAYIVLTADKNLKEFQNIAESRSGTFPQITFDSIADFEIRLPELEIQKKIAEIIGAYNSKIENNNLIIEKLESMSQVLFEQLHANKLEEVPEGWNLKDLSEVSDVLFGHNFKANLFNESGDGVMVVRIRDVLSGTTETFSPEKIEDKYKIYPGDLLIGMDGVFHMSMWYSEGSYLNQRVVRIRSEIPTYFLLQSIKAQLDFLQRTITGATVGHLSNGDIRGFKILLPSDKNIFEPFKNITNKVLAIKNENVVLRAQRDELLAKLI
jgi:type I restriction enzyme S subunit